MNHAPAILVVPALIYSTHRLDYCCHFHLCSLVGRYTVLEVWAVRRLVRVSCGSRWGRCGLFINILDSLTVPYIRPCIQYTACAASMAGAYVHTLAGAASAWFIRTRRVALICWQLGCVYSTGNPCRFSRQRGCSYYNVHPIHTRSFGMFIPTPSLILTLSLNVSYNPICTKPT